VSGLLFYDLGVTYRGVKGRRPRRAMVDTFGEFSDDGVFVEYYVVWYWTGRGRRRSRVLRGTPKARRMMDKWLGDGAQEVRS